MADNRTFERQGWVARRLGEGWQIVKLAGDASFRSYYRVEKSGVRYVLMDAPPAHEDVRPFLAVQGWMEKAGLRVPHIEVADQEAGFLLLEDFGDTTWAAHLAAGGDLEPMIADALDQLRKLHAAGAELALFDYARMQRECHLFTEWYLPKVAGVVPSGREIKAFDALLEPLLQGLLKLPRVPVHLDYHSRNLMLLKDGLPLGVIDFQDAVLGPVTYDLASLLYDCYQDYPENERRKWSELFFNALPDHLRNAFDSFESWHRALRLTAFQRHIKAIGIFARLAYRDGKQKFLEEIPLTRKHLLEEMDVLGIDPDGGSLLQLSPK